VPTDCPNCDLQLDDGSEECPRCRIVLARWQDRKSQPRILPPEPDHALLSKDNPAGRTVLIWTTIAIAAVGSYRIVSKLASDGGRVTDESSVAVQQTVDETTENPAADSIDLSRLEPILSEIRSQTGAHGVGVSVNDLRHHFEKGAQLLHPAVSRSRGAQVGLPHPETQGFTEEEQQLARSGGMKANKCLRDGRWAYLDHLPATDGTSQCWHRQSGQRRHDTGAMVIHYGNSRIDRWERWVWQPSNGRWAPYSEHDEQRILEHMIDTDYGYEAIDRDRERSREDLDRALANTSLREPYRSQHIKQAILSGYRTRIEREGASWRLEQ